MLQPLDKPLVYEAVEEGHFLRTLLHHRADDILDHGLRHVHVPLEVAEGHFRLDHPELGGVALGVGVLRPEGGAEGVHVAEGHGEVLGVELAGDGEAGLLSEEILGVVDPSILRPGRVVQIQGGYLEHLAGPLTVRAGDEGGVDIDKAPILEEAVDGVGRHAPYPESCGKQIRPGPQVLDGAQKLDAVPLFLQGVVGGGGPLHLDGGRLHLQGLLGLRGKRHLSLDDEGGAHVLPGDFLVVVQDVGVHDHLEVFKAGTVVELNKAEGFHIPDGAGPAHYGDILPAQALLIGKDGGNSCTFHIDPLHISRIFQTFRL